MNEGTVAVIPGFVHVALLDEEGKVQELAIERMPTNEIYPGERLDVTVNTSTDYTVVDQVVMLPDWDEDDSSATSMSILGLTTGNSPSRSNGTKPRVQSKPVIIAVEDQVQNKAE